MATTNFVADWVQNVGGDRVEVFSLLPTDADPHSFQPGARDVARVADADLVFSVGLGLEQAWLHELLENAARDEDAIVALAEAIEPIDFVDLHDDHDDHMEGPDDHMEHVTVMDCIAQSIHDFEDGKITAEEAIQEIRDFVTFGKPQPDDHDDEDGHDHDEEDDHDDHGDEDDHDDHDEEEDHDDHDDDDHDDDHDEEDDHDDHDDEDDHDDHDEEDDHDDHDHSDLDSAGEEEAIAEVAAILAELDEGHISLEDALEEIHHVVEEHEHASEDDHDDHDDHDDEDDHDDHDDEDDHDDHDDEDDHDDHDDEDDHDDGHGHGHAHGAEDPHFWFDPLRVKEAIDLMVGQMVSIDPAGAETYAANASAYKAELDELDAWTLEQVANVPESQRYLVTSHDSFGYFADRYGFEVVGAVIPSFTTDVDPSAEHMAGLIDTVNDYGVKAIFGENTVSERLAQAVADETGVKLVRLYTGSLGAADSGAGTYLEMVRTNVTRIVEALR